MKLDDAFLGADERCVLQYLNTWREEFVAEKQIARHAGGKQRFHAESGWAGNSLSQLLMMGLVETDFNGRYRVRVPRSKTVGDKKFITPHLREILEKSGRNFDLNSYAP